MYIHKLINYLPQLSLIIEFDYFQKKGSQTETSPKLKQLKKIGMSMRWLPVLLLAFVSVFLANVSARTVGTYYFHFATYYPAVRILISCYNFFDADVNNVTMETRACLPPHDSYDWCNVTKSHEERVRALVDNIVANHRAAIPPQLTARNSVL
jgi:hypothetical protein